MSEDANQKRIQAQMEKEQKIRNTPFAALNREDALLRMSFMQKDQTQIHKAVLELQKEKKAIVEQLAVLKVKTELVFETMCETNPNIFSEMEKRVVVATGYRKILAGEPIKHYDRLTTNFTGYKDDKPQPTMSGRNTTFDLNFQNFITDVEAGFVGMVIGEKKTIEATFPETYKEAPEMAGKVFRFDLELISAQRNVKVESLMAEKDSSDRTKILEEMTKMKMMPTNAAEMTTEELRSDLIELRKEFAQNQKSPDGVVHSSVPPGNGGGEITLLPNAIQ
jgi:hypothetical protein